MRVESTGPVLIGRWLTLARILWIALAIPTIGLLILVAIYERPVFGALADFGWSAEAYQAALAQLGLPAAALEGLFRLSTNLSRLSFVGVSVGLFWRRPDDAMAYFTSLTLLTFSVTAAGAFDLPPDMPALAAFVTFIQAFGQACFLLFILIFPDGHFVPGWMRWPTLAAVLVTTVLSRVPAVQATWVGSAGTWLAILWLLLTTIPSQIYRYRRVSTPLQRQQTKLVVVSIAVFLVGGAGSWLVGDVLLPRLALGGVPTAGSSARLLYDLVMIGMQVLPTLALPLALGVAILRYRLWDIDVLIRRTLIYSALTGLLALAYFGSVVVLERLFRALTGQGQNSLVVVLSTLAIAALFGPLRGRVQRTIDRRFYRRKYDATRILGAFGTSIRDDVDLNDLSQRLVGVVDETMQPAHVSLWVRKAARR